MTNFLIPITVNQLPTIAELDGKQGMFILPDGSININKQDGTWMIINKQSDHAGILEPNETVSVQPGVAKWYWAGPGIYNNVGGFTIDDFGILSFTGTQWQYLEVKIPELAQYNPGSKISGIKNGALNPELAIEVINIEGSPVKVPDNLLPPFLKKLGLQYFFKKTKTISGNIELYPQINEQSAIMPKEGNYVRLSYYVWGTDEPPVALQFGTDNRQRLFVYNPSGLLIIYPYRSENITLGNRCYKVDLSYKIPANFLNLNQIMLEIIMESNNYIPIGTDIYFGGINLTISGNDKFDINNELSLSQANAALTLARQNEIDIASLNSGKEDFNNIKFNQTALAPFLRKYLTKKVDDFNEITIALVGDSIFGRQDNPSFNPSSPEISLTEDFNDANETQPGYVTGHFPPNMWERLVGYKVLKMLQYNDSDVKYYNHVASEVTKSGNWVNAFPVGADCLRLATVTNLNSYIELSFSSATHAKFIYSCYGTDSTGRKIKVTFSDNNGLTWKIPADLSLVESYPSHTDGSGIYILPDQEIKWGNIKFKGLDKTKSYKIRVQKLDADPLAVWGFETWSNPRVNVVIAAEGGNNAYVQANRPERFYNSMYNQDLIIYNIPYLNDFGTGFISKYKGSINLSSSVPSNPVSQDFYFVSVSGNYSNFGNLNLQKGDYVEWTGTAWKKGSSQIDFALEVYLSENKRVYERALKIGIPVICLVTHNSLSFNDRPFAEFGLKLQRLFLKEYGLPHIDINRYQEVKNLQNITSEDGTHLNDSGVNMYADQLATVLLPDNKFVGISPGKFKPEVLRGSASGNVVNFEFEFKDIPTIRIFNNSAISVTGKTKKGFTTTGSGSYDWEAFII